MIFVPEILHKFEVSRCGDRGLHWNGGVYLLVGYRDAPSREDICHVGDSTERSSKTRLTSVLLLTRLHYDAYLTIKHVTLEILASVHRRYPP